MFYSLYIRVPAERTHDVVQSHILLLRTNVKTYVNERNLSWDLQTFIHHSSNINTQQYSMSPLTCVQQQVLQKTIYLKFKALKKCGNRQVIISRDSFFPLPPNMF